MDGKRLIFLDESGININMIRRYGRSVGKHRVVDHAPLSTPSTTTIVSSIRLNGRTVTRAFSGSMTGDRFKEYLKNDLVPTLHPGDMVIMDNLRSHKVPGVGELIKSAGAILVYLPPYSPDFNPAEPMWSKVKAWYKKHRFSTSSELLAAVPRAFDSVSLSDCLGWFSHCGYCL